ncbi:MAG: hypothetical protein IKX00_00295 [Bacilli bacterium]|nr:hypothetical protein [Bacilli bacterium]
MKKVLIYLLIIAIGSAGVYYGLTKYNNKDNKQTNNTNKGTNKKSNNTNNKIEKDDNTEIVPSRDAFISEAIKLQTLAENANSNDPCKCYSVQDLDKNTSLSGSILVYTNDDLFISNMWLSNGYYLLDGYDNPAANNLIESKETASLYCGEESADVKSSLCSISD